MCGLGAPCWAHFSLPASWPLSGWLASWLIAIFQVRHLGLHLPGGLCLGLYFCFLSGSASPAGCAHTCSVAVFGNYSLEPAPDPEPSASQGTYQQARHCRSPQTASKTVPTPSRDADSRPQSKVCSSSAPAADCAHSQPSMQQASSSAAAPAQHSLQGKCS